MRNQQTENKLNTHKLKEGVEKEINITKQLIIVNIFTTSKSMAVYQHVSVLIDLFTISKTIYNPLRIVIPVIVFEYLKLLNIPNKANKRAVKNALGVT